MVEALVVPANADTDLAWMKRMTGVAQGIDIATELVKELVNRTVEGDEE